MAGPEENKAVVSRMIEEVMNGGDSGAIDDLYTPEAAAAARRWIEGDSGAIDDLYTPEAAAAARRWIEPFLRAFPDVEMRTVELVAEGEIVVGRFKCSATHTGEWRGEAPTGRRFEDIDEVYFFRFRDGRIAGAWGLEDTSERVRQLGLSS